nr:retrovirus-related Pol polyprotein from transposon TNT 1-94 [Tanacetum cinerariifolium]
MNLKLDYQTFRAKTTEILSQTYTRYKTLHDKLANDSVNLSKQEINFDFVNSLPEKWLTFSQGLRNANHTQTLDLADIYERFVYEDNLIQKRPVPPFLRTQRSFNQKNKGLVAETFDWDEEEVLDDEEVTRVKVLMALADEELTVGKNYARNGKWIDITIRKPYQYASPSKQILKAKENPFPPCIHCSFNNHRPDDCRNYPECEICRSYDTFTSRHNRIIHIKGGVLAESSQS